MAKKNKKANFTPSPGQIAWGVLYLAVQYTVLGELLGRLYGLLGLDLSLSVQNFIYFCVNFLAAVVIFRKYLANHLSSLGKNWWDCLKALILGYVFYWVSNYALSWALSKLIPGFANLNDGQVALLLRENFYLMAIGVVILAPVAEEVFYRGLVFGSLYSRSRAAAYIISCLLFSAIHVLGYIGSASAWVVVGCFLQYIPAGLCLAWSFQESGSIFVPIAIHILVNALGIFSMR